MRKLALKPSQDVGGGAYKRTHHPLEAKRQSAHSVATVGGIQTQGECQIRLLPHALSLLEALVPVTQRQFSTHLVSGSVEDPREAGSGVALVCVVSIHTKGSLGFMLLST